MKKRLLQLIALTVLAQDLFAGCGGDGDSADEDNPNGGAVDDEGPAAFTAASAKAGAKPKALLLSWTFEGNADHFTVELRSAGATDFAQVDLNRDGMLNEGDRIARANSSAEVLVPLHLINLDTSRYRVTARNAAGVERARSAEISMVDAMLDTLVGYFKASNTGALDSFGTSLALSADGKTLAVGASGEDSNTNTIEGNQSDDSALASGAVYVFVRSTAGLWVQQAYIKASNAGTYDYFGVSVSLSANGDILAVAAQGEDAAHAGASEDNSKTASGAVYIYSRDPAGVWTSRAYLKASNADPYDAFGADISLSADGKTLAVGAPLESSNGSSGPGDNSASYAGAAYIYVRGDSGGWAERAYLKASNADAFDFFGNDLSLSADGNTLAVGASSEDASHAGAPQDNSKSFSGAAYVYVRNESGMWTEQAYLKASSADEFDHFGNSISLSADGNTIAIGALDEAGANASTPQDNSKPSSGAAYVYVRNASGMWTEQAYLKASNLDENDLFGSSLVLSADDKTLAVGATGESSSRAGGPQDNSRTASGAAYIYRREGLGIWIERAYLKASNVGESDFFGNEISLSGDGLTLAVGATGEGSNATGVNGNPNDNSAPASGAVYLY